MALGDRRNRVDGAATVSVKVVVCPDASTMATVVVPTLRNVAVNVPPLAATEPVETVAMLVLLTVTL